MLVGVKPAVLTQNWKPMDALTETAKPVIETALPGLPPK